MGDSSQSDSCSLLLPGNGLRCVSPTFRPVSPGLKAIPDPLGRGRADPRRRDRVFFLLSEGARARSGAPSPSGRGTRAPRVRVFIGDRVSCCGQDFWARRGRWPPVEFGRSGDDRSSGRRWVPVAHGPVPGHPALTESLAAPLTAEDQTVQSMPDVSPTKWHRAHTTWFFETFLLEAQQQGYRPFHPSSAICSTRTTKASGRGIHGRPGADLPPGHRRHRRLPRLRRRAMESLLEVLPDEATGWLVELGINHEQQHQELLLMDIKHVLSLNPLLPAYDDLCLASPPPRRPPTGPALRGHLRHRPRRRGFSFDNESPRHRVYLGGSRSPTGR